MLLQRRAHRLLILQTQGLWLKFQSCFLLIGLQISTLLHLMLLNPLLPWTPHTLNTDLCALHTSYFYCYRGGDKANPSTCTRGSTAPLPSWATLSQHHPLPTPISFSPLLTPATSIKLLLPEQPSAPSQPHSFNPLPSASDPSGLTPSGSPVTSF